MESERPTAVWAIVVMTAFCSCGGRTELFGHEQSDVTGASVGSGGMRTGNTSEVGGASDAGVGNGGQSNLGGSSATGGFSPAVTGGVAATGGAAAGGGSSTTLSVIELALGGEHTCALLSTGSVRCWGSGSFGELGYGNTNTLGDATPPSSAGDVMLSTSAAGIGAGYYHTCAVLTGGKVQCWGLGIDGELGYGNSSNR